MTAFDLSTVAIELDDECGDWVEEMGYYFGVDAN